MNEHRYTNVRTNLSMTEIRPCNVIDVKSYRRYSAPEIDLGIKYGTSRAPAWEKKKDKQKTSTYSYPSKKVLLYDSNASSKTQRTKDERRHRGINRARGHNVFATISALSPAKFLKVNPMSYMSFSPGFSHFSRSDIDSGSEFYVNTGSSLPDIVARGSNPCVPSSYDVGETAEAGGSQATVLHDNSPQTSMCSSDELYSTDLSISELQSIAADPIKTSDSVILPFENSYHDSLSSGCSALLITRL